MRFPAVKSVRFAPLTAPKLPDQVPDVMVPTEVREEAVTPDPKVVPDRTSVPLILYVLPEATFKF